MARALEDAYWLHEESVSSVLFPRSYNPGADQQAFVEDFRATAAAGMLEWFVRGMSAEPEMLAADPEKRAIPIASLEFAVERCHEAIAVATHEDVDDVEGGERPSDEEWDLFLDNFTAAVHEGAGIECSSEESREHLQVNIKTMTDAQTIIHDTTCAESVRDYENFIERHFCLFLF